MSETRVETVDKNLREIGYPDKAYSIYHEDLLGFARNFAAEADRQEKEIKRLLAERVADKATIAKLPHTADGVAVVSGIKVYERDPTGYIQGYDVGTNMASDDSSCPSGAYLMYSHCYSTREAAEEERQDDARP